MEGYVKGYTTRVTRFELDSDDAFIAKITVVRVPEVMIVMPITPKVEDVPSDVKQALLEWLGTY